MKYNHYKDCGYCCCCICCYCYIVSLLLFFFVILLQFTLHMYIKIFFLFMFEKLVHLLLTNTFTLNVRMQLLANKQFCGKLILLQLLLCIIISILFIILLFVISYVISDTRSETCVFCCCYKCITTYTQDGSCTLLFLLLLINPLKKTKIYVKY